jgi:general secretion pathway protein G
MVIGRKHNIVHGFTLVEVLIAMAIGLTLAALAIPSILRSIDNARVARAMADIDALEADIEAYDQLNDSLPNTLADIGRDQMLDPWGHPYQYLNFANAKGKGKMRKDRFLVPINSTYDLYSMGKDGQSVPPLTAKVSHDDIIRASDGAYLGLASNY